MYIYISLKSSQCFNISCCVDWKAIEQPWFLSSWSSQFQDVLDTQSSSLGSHDITAPSSHLPLWSFLVPWWSAQRSTLDNVVSSDCMAILISVSFLLIPAQANPLGCPLGSLSSTCLKLYTIEPTPQVSPII